MREIDIGGAITRFAIFVISIIGGLVIFPLLTGMAGPQDLDGLFSAALLVIVIGALLWPMIEIVRQNVEFQAEKYIEAKVNLGQGSTVSGIECMTRGGYYIFQDLIRQGMVNGMIQLNGMVGPNTVESQLISLMNKQNKKTEE